MKTTDRIRTLLQSATPGEWRADEDGEYAGFIAATDGVTLFRPGINNERAREDALAAVESHNALPALLDVVDAAEVVAREGAMMTQEELDALRTALGKLKGE